MKNPPESNRTDRRAFLGTASKVTGATLLSSTFPGLVAAADEPILHIFNFAAAFKGDLYYPAIIAEREGFYRDEQLGVNINYGFGGGDSMRLVAAGRLPVNGGDAGAPLVLARSRGADVSLACTYFVGESNTLVAPPEIKSYDDLPSDEILLGISNPTASSTVASLIMLRQAGIDLDRVTPVTVGGSNARYAAVVARTVHVGAAVLSVASRAPLDNLNVLGHAKDEIYPSVFISHSVNNAWVDASQENFDLAVRNTTATLRGLHWGFSNKDKMLKWLEEEAKIPREVVGDYYALAFESERPLMSSDGKLLEPAWKNTFDALQFAGQLEPPFPKIADLQRDDIYEAAIKRLREVYKIELPPSKAEQA